MLHTYVFAFFVYKVRMKVTFVHKSELVLLKGGRLIMNKMIKAFSLGLAVIIATISLPISTHAGCAQHSFYQRYLAVVYTTMSEHTVGIGTEVKVCKITTTGHACVDVCSKCGYSGPGYVVTSDCHSVDNH